MWTCKALLIVTFFYIAVSTILGNTLVPRKLRSNAYALRIHKARNAYTECSKCEKSSHSRSFISIYSVAIRLWISLMEAFLC